MPVVPLDKRRPWRLSPLVWTLLITWAVLVAAWWYQRESALGPSLAVVEQVPSSPEALPAVASPSVEPVPAAESLPAQALLPQPGERLASDWAAEYRQPDQALVTRHQGRPFKVLGQVVEQQASPAGVVLVQLDAGQGLPPLRVVMATGTLVDQIPPVGQAATFACLHGGVMMGEPLLRDCQVVRREP